MPLSNEEIAIVKGMLAYRSSDGLTFRQQQISAYFNVNNARISEVRYGDRGIGAGVEPAPQSKFPNECWKWPMTPPSRGRNATLLRRKKMLKEGSVDLTDINKKIKPIVRFFIDESTKHVVTMSASAIARHAGLLQKCLDDWNEITKKQKGNRK
jgi:hypothetical protein